MGTKRIKRLEEMHIKGNCVRHIGTAEQANAEFIKRMKRRPKNEGDNFDNELDKFLAIAKHILTSGGYGSFSFNDFLLYAKAFDLDRNRVFELFEVWAETLCHKAVLTRHEGCYEYPVYSQH